MTERTLKALEYGKFLQQIAQDCVSEPAGEAALLLRPLPSCAEAREAVLLVEEARAWSALAEPGGYRLAPFPDLRALLPAVAVPAAVPDPETLWALRETLREAHRAVTRLTGDAGRPVGPRLAAFAAVPLPERTRGALERCLNDEGALRDESSPELLAVRQDLRGLHRNCLRRVKDFARQYNMEHYLQDELMGLASDRYVLPLKANFRGRMQGIIHHWSQTGESCWFEPLFLVDINNRIQELKQREREEERKVAAYLASLAREEAPALEAAFDFLVRLDLLLAECRIADRIGAVHLSLGEEGGAELLRARHPLLALRGAAEPVDIVLRSGERALVISGGNAGGKTVCLKTLGLIAALALTGLPVPVERASHLPAWSDIHAFIGDEQSLDNKLSTFTAQIRHLAEAWRRLDGGSLMLLDEFGAGTDPAQGAALAQAVLDEALERGAYVAAATHFPALKLYAVTRPLVRSASVLFDPQTGAPLFSLAYDQVGAGRALDTARAYGLPESILRRAEQHMLPGAEDAGRIMARLNELAVEREGEILALRQEQERARAQRERLRERFERERETLHGEVRARAQELMRAWKEGRATHKQALKEMARLRASLAAARREEETRELALRPGLRVRHRAFGRQGTVLEIDERKKRVRLDMDGVSLWTSSSELEAPERARAAETSPPARGPGAGSASFRLDLRGRRADEAQTELGSFLDRALLAGSEEVEILHGRGTGALRREVHNFLRTFPGIREVRLAPEDRGGDGLTLVSFV